MERIVFLEKTIVDLDDTINRSQQHNTNAKKTKFVQNDLEQYKNFIASIVHDIKGELGHIKFAADNMFDLLQNQTAECVNELRHEISEFSHSWE